MEGEFIEIRIRGKEVRVPATRIGDRTVVSVGKWLRIASVQDEMWLAGDVVTDPEHFVALLKERRFPADIFTFSQKPPFHAPQFNYRNDPDNLAVITTSDFKDWWANSLPRVARKNVRRAAKRGVEVRSVPLDDVLIRGVVTIYNETPVRQGRRFPHYGKDFATIKREVSTFPEASEFLGAYHEGQLIGFVKLVYLGEIASILHILSLNLHADKRPTNALIARAVLTCHQKGLRYLVYGKYDYGKKSNSRLTEFKARNGFEKIVIPRYYIPLTRRGRVALRLKLHLGLLGILPTPVVDLLVTVRAKLTKRRKPSVAKVVQAAAEAGAGPAVAD